MQLPSLLQIVSIDDVTLAVEIPTWIGALRITYNVHKTYFMHL
jgi:hypothetical protein